MSCPHKGQVITFFSLFIGERTVVALLTRLMLAMGDWLGGLFVTGAGVVTNVILEIDPTHSQVSFAIRVMWETTTRGSFNTLRGQLNIDEQNPASSWVEAEVDAASIDTHNLLRDTHLRSSAFFAVKHYPTIAFRSTLVEHIGGSAYQVTGNLTLLRTTRPITFDVAYSGQSAGLPARAQA